jgi:uncharacterized membrane protein YdjX (TVP38/TMEM64 family)
MDRKQLVLVAAICGGVTALGALLPWYSIKTPFVSTSASGIDSGRGVVVLLLGIAGGLAALLVHLGKAGQVVKLNEAQHFYVTIGCLGVAALLAVITFFGDFEKVEAMGQSMGPSRGLGLWLSLLGSIGGAAAAFLVVRKSAGPGAAGP